MIDIFNIAGGRTFLGNGFADWGLLILGIIASIIINPIFLFFSFLWLENFFLDCLIPSIIDRWNIK